MNDLVDFEGFKRSKISIFFAKIAFGTAENGPPKGLENASVYKPHMVILVTAVLCPRRSSELRVSALLQG